MLTESADIVIAGGGMAGFSAAMSAASTGANVILIDRLERIGGNAVNSNVGTICGAYYRNLENKIRPVGVSSVQNFIAELVHQMKTRPVLTGQGLYVIPYEWSTLSQLIENKLKDAGIDVWTNTIVEQADSIEKKISSIAVNKNGEKISLQPKAIVDCTGNGMIHQLLRLELLDSETYQAASQVFRISVSNEANEFSLDMTLKKVLKQFSAGNISVTTVPGSFRNGCVDLKLSLQTKITDAVNTKQEIKKEVELFFQHSWSVLCSKIIFLQQAKIINIFPEPGIRVQQRAKGKYVLTETDVLCCEKTDDTVALGTWPVEEWNFQGNVSMQYFAPDDAYGIPAACIYTDEIKNLFFAGKNVSATDKAIASARVIGTCLQTGYAAGLLAVCRDEPEKRNCIATIHKDLLLHSC